MFNLRDYRYLPTYKVVEKTAVSTPLAFKCRIYLERYEVKTVWKFYIRGLHNTVFFLKPQQSIAPDLW